MFEEVWLCELSATEAEIFILARFVTVALPETSPDKTILKSFTSKSRVLSVSS